MIPMTTNVNKSGGYLEVIVSEVVQLVLTQQVLDRVRVAMTRSRLFSEEGPLLGLVS